MSLPDINRLIIRLFSMGILVCLSLMSAKSQTPGLKWARALNGTGPGVAYPESIVTDAAKNVYTVGSFRNTIDANPGAGTFLLTSAGQADIFVSKLDAAGNFVWALRIGGTGSDVAQAITLDVLGNVYLTGSFTGTVDFDPGPGIVNLAGGGSFAFSLDANGSLNWAGRIGSGTGKAIAIDAADNLLIGGDFTGSSDFDPGAGTVTLTSAGSVDIFVSKFALDGTLIWAKQMGGTAADFCFGVDTDATNNVYTSGGFSGTADFNPGVAVNNLTSAGLSDIYISKLDAAGAYVLAVKIGGTGSESTNSLTVDGGGNVLLAGDYAGTVDFDPGASVSNLTSAGSSDIFVAKYSSTGAHIWSRSVGGPSSDRPSHVITDAVGDVYMTGNFQGTADFDPGAGVFNLVAGTGNQEAYVSKLTSAGNFSWALRTESTASGETEGIAVALDTSGDILIAGWFELIVDFDPGSCVYSLPSNGDDIFVMKLSPSSLGCIPPTITSFSPASGPVGTTVIIDGLQFSPTPSNNTVYFGAVRANVTAATTTQLTVTVPPGVAHDRISVMVGGLVGLSRDPFLLNYGYNQVIGPSSFAPKIDLSAGLEPYALAQGDFDLDGRVDLVSANYSGSTVSVFQNSSSGPGNIGYAAKVDFTVGLGRPYAITAGDFDGDGKQDFAVANEFTNTVAVFRNTSSGPGNINFAPRVEFATGAFPHGITAADFNYDGKLDLAVTSNNLDVVSVYSNLSSGSGNINFAPRIDFAAGDASQDVTHADLDLDGRPDLIVTNYSAQSISVLRNTSASGAINFAAKTDITTGTLPNFVSTGDVDGDGKLDLTVANALSETISIFRNLSSPGAITLAGKADVSAIGAFAVGLGDLNGDGKVDLAVPDFGSNVTAIQNTSAGPGNVAFGIQQGFATGNTPQFVGIGDYDGDGKPDLAVANQSSNTLSILRNTILIPPPTITGFTPPFGPVGTSVTVTGTNFSPLAGNNIVYFGATKAVVSAATSTQLTVTAPAGSTYNPLSVTVSGKTAYAPAPFVATYTSTGVINATTFAAKVDFSTATEPTEAIIGDLDGDGKPDVASINNSTPSITTFRNTSTPGTVSFATAVDFPAGTNAQAMEVGDIDADGKLDLVTVDWTPQVSVFRNTGTPGTINFATHVNFTTGTSPVKVAIGDLDGDGLTDLVVANGGTNSVSVFRNTGSPGTISFAPRINLTTGANPYDVSVSDMDGDGLKDIIVPSRSAHVVSIFRNTSTPGTLSFASAVDLALGIGNQPFSIATGDLNDDNKADIAVLYRTTKLLAVIRNNSSPGNLTTATFDSPVTYSTSPSDPAYVAFGDVSGDGKPDVLVGNDNGTTVQVLKNLTSPGPFSIVSFAASVSYTTGSRPNTVKSGDIDGDQLPDLIVANSVSNTVSVLRNQSGSCVPAAQRNALIALYNATDGVNWTDNTGWLSADESTWTGITVTGCDITDITLPGNNLVGSIPPEIGDLVMLEGLDLGLNQLSGSIPPEIGNLTSLIGLNLAVNQLDGFLPPELGNLTSLEALNLSFNRLGGTPPIELENLLALVDAALNNNQFIGQPPLIGGNSIAMSTVQLQFNEFTALPDFTAYYSINLINVSNNRLTFDDLEPFMAISNFFYDPQALVPPGGIISFIPGGTLSIPFATGGTGNSYQWYKDNVLIPGATSSALSIPGVTAADVGFYQVRITSSVVPGLILQSMVYTVITDPCVATTPTSGGIDITFAPLIDAPSTFSQVEMQSTGNIITESGGTVINSVSRLGLLRFLPDGTLDNTFTPNINTSPFLIQPDDQILASYYGGAYAYVVRMDADGNEDAAFKANVPQYYSGYISALARESDNKILVAGAAYLVPPFIERLNPDGTSDGLLPDANGLDVNVIRVQSDGYILVGGLFPGGIIRLDPTGTIDPSFIAYTEGLVSDIAIQSDGKILVGGSFSSMNDIPKRGIVRLHPDGTLDNTFTALGITNPSESGLNVRKIAIQTDGKIVLAGEFSMINGADRINLARLNSDGTLDCLFDPGTGTDLAITGLTLPSDSQILVSGSFGDYGGTQRLGIARVNAGSGGPAITITLQPADASACENTITTLTTSAIGTTNIIYQWQFSPDGIAPFVDIVDGGGYSGVSAPALSVNTTGGFGAGQYRCRINGDLATEVITANAGLVVNSNPSPPGATGGSACSSGAIALTASGASAGQYRWYTTLTGGTAIAGEVNDTYTTPVLTVTTTFYVSIHNGTCESISRTPVTATINTPPSPPTTTGVSSCVPGAFILSASGGSPGEYRWYAAATGGTDLGSGNDTFTTPSLTVTTTYHVAINNGTCESARTPVTAAIDAVAKPVIQTSNCTATGATLTGPAGFAVYAWSNGATTSQISVTTGGTYTLVVTSAGGCVSPASDAVTFTNSFCNQPPALQPTSVTTTVQSTVTVNISAMASDLDNNIDLSTLQVINQPASGATAFINANFELVIDYSSVSFAGTDQLTIELCDVAGACVQEVITVEVAGEITVFNALSPNGDGKNDVFFIQYINALPETQQNKVTILNRWGTVVFEINNYDNSTNVFCGLSSGGDELPSGTYYYILEFSSGAAKRTGFISLRR